VATTLLLAIEQPLTLPGRIRRAWKSCHYHQATAMTSPHAASEEVVAAMATTSFDDSPQNIDLTAADNSAANDTNNNSASNTTTTIMAEDALEEQPTTLQPQKNEQVINKDTIPDMAPTILEALPINGGLIVEPAIPQLPQIDETSSQFPPVSVADYAQMQNLSAMLPYTQPELIYNDAVADLAMPALPARLSHQEPYADGPQYLRENDETRISAYALLEFEDGQFYMNTYSVILGRDLAAARAAMRRDAEEQKLQLEAAENTKEPKTPVKVKREGTRYTKSVISEIGGILREGDDSDSDDRLRRRKSRKASKKSKSTGSSSQRISRRDSLVQPNGKIDYQPQPQVRRHAPDTIGAVPVDPASLRPSPYDCPLVGIHPPASTPASGYKAISRQHVKIAYNSKKSLFEAEIIGRNGAFVDDVFYYHEDVIPLKSGSYLQIGGVVVRFVLPDVAIGETGAEHPIGHDDYALDRYAEGGKEMSFEFEETARDGVMLGDTSDEGSDDADHPQPGIEDEDAEEEEEAEEEGKGEGEIEDVADEGDHGDHGDEDGDNSDLSDVPDEYEGQDDQNEDEDNLQQSLPIPQKRRGPGRPPKNGIMSKREQQLAKREAQEKAARKTIPHPEGQGQGGGKNKVGRPRKHPLPEESPIKTEKRKYTKRKPKDPDAIGIKHEGSGSQDEDRPKEKKEKKSTKPPRSPSPTFNEADLTPEQLAKPQANYVTLIHEALSNSPTGQMSLPQIYRAIQRRYPFFVLKCNTNGWQSSVRHNLSQHHAFRKVERDGKGWMWAIVDGVSIEKEKKRRPTPPHQLPPGHLHQPIYRAGLPPHHMMHGPPGMMAPPPGYTMNPHMPPHLRPGQPPQYPPQPMNGYALPPPQPQINGLPPPGFPGSLPPTQPLGVGVPGNHTYSSPYATKPAQNPGPAQIPHQPGQGHPQNAPPPQMQPLQQHPSLHNDKMNQAVQIFRNALLTKMKGRESIIDSAIDRVLKGSTKNTSTPPPTKDEETIIRSLRDMLNKIPGVNLSGSQQAPIHSIQPPQQYQGMPNAPQSQAGMPQACSIPQNTGSPHHIEKPPSAPVPRPSFAGQSQNRPTGSMPVPRPPMMTPGMARTNSSGPTNPPPRNAQSASASPAPAHSSTNGQPHMSSGNSQAQPPVIHQQQLATNENGKRPLGNDDMGGNDFKRLSTTGPPALTT
jgi:hypothetical protein